MPAGGVSTDTPGATDALYRRLARLLHQKVRIDYVGGTNPIYVGYAEAGTATSAKKWSIAQFTWDGSNNPTAVDWAGGTIDYAFAWDDRAGLSYS